MSLGIGVVYEFAPFLAHRAEADAISDFFKKANGEPPQSFTFASSAIRTSASRARPTRWGLRRLRMQWN
jgi:hypothetical protein